MLKMIDTTEEEPPSSSHQNAQAFGTAKSASENNALAPNGAEKQKGLFSWVKTIFKSKSDTSLRETIEEYIEDPNGYDDHAEDEISQHEKSLLSNVLKLRDTVVIDVMVPRADIFAIDVETTEDELLQILTEKQYTRIPVYKDRLDDVLGTIHIKDIISQMAAGRSLNILEMVREVQIISPSMNVSDLMLQMRNSRKQMAMVVDEFGGIDGLVTIGDVLEAIVGEIDDEHDIDEHPQLTQSPEGDITADARVSIDTFETEFGYILEEEEREDSDTLGGLVFDLAGRVPALGEVITHDSGMTFEILEADPRRIHKIRIANLPNPKNEQ